jgi:arylsulfatase A-like enzyme
MPEQPPNILLIVTETQRGDCLGLDGHPVLQTPNMDLIGGAGTHFRRAYSEVPSCIPARHVLMSGQAPADVGMVGFHYRDHKSPWNPPATLAGALRDTGYETRLIGKLHLQPQRRRYGFDAIELADGMGGTHNDYVDWLRDRGVPKDQLPAANGVGSNGWVGRPTHLPEHLTYSAWVVTRAIEFLEKRDPSAPFFLNLSFFPAHAPMTPSQPFFDRYDRLDLGKPEIGGWAADFAAGETGLPLDRPSRGLDPDGWDYGRRVNLDPLTMHYCRSGYFGLINEIDSQIGRLYHSMRGLLDNTIIMLVSDHGEMLGDHYCWAKPYPFEGAARVPLLIRPPRPSLVPPAHEPLQKHPRGVVCDAPVGLQDVMPTLLDAAGVPVPESCTGRTLMPFVRGESPEWRDVLHGEHAGTAREEDGFHYLVDHRWKYVWYSQTDREFLFDLETDPNELHDRSPEHDLQPWRQRLARELNSRPEGFSNGDELIVGQPHRVFVPGRGPQIGWPGS